MRWNRYGSVHWQDKPWENLPISNTDTQANNTAGCYTMTEHVPERLNTARYTAPAQRGRAGRQAGRQAVSEALDVFTLMLPLPPSVSALVIYLSLSV